MKIDLESMRQFIVDKANNISTEMDARKQEIRNLKVQLNQISDSLRSNSESQQKIIESNETLKKISQVLALHNRKLDLIQTNSTKSQDASNLQLEAIKETIIGIQQASESIEDQRENLQKIISQIDQISSGNNSQILNALLENQHRLKGLLDSQTQNTNSKLDEISAKIDEQINLDEITSKIDQVATRIDENSSTDQFTAKLDESSEATNLKFTAIFETLDQISKKIDEPINLDEITSKIDQIATRIDENSSTDQFTAKLDESSEATNLKFTAIFETLDQISKKIDEPINLDEVTNKVDQIATDLIEISESHDSQFNQLNQKFDEHSRRTDQISDSMTESQHMIARLIDANANSLQILHDVIRTQQSIQQSIESQMRRTDQIEEILRLLLANRLLDEIAPPPRVLIESKKIETESVTTSQSEELETYSTKMDTSSSKSPSPSKLPLTVGVIGDDNCGKSTIISLLEEAISEKSSLSCAFEFIEFPKWSFNANVDVAILVISTQKGLTWWARKTVRRAQYFAVKKFIAYINDDGWIDENELESAITDFFYYRDLNFQIVHDIDELVYELDNL